MRMKGRGDVSPFAEGGNPGFLCMEGLCFVDPFLDSEGYSGHGENHGGDLLINPKGELVNESGVVLDVRLGGEILEIGDVLLKAIICGPIRAFEGFLD